MAKLEHGIKHSDVILFTTEAYIVVCKIYILGAIFQVVEILNWVLMLQSFEGTKKEEEHIRVYTIDINKN